ncbi:S1 RNA-binding domain-containing protein [Streptomyces sp. NPDC007369]|uniref:S1 RNA-binding domain-containing protein n=1 Tax=Streptomyces sp. NPDC007369 TaxID=3154589 RepID=UPI0033E47107
MNWQSESPELWAFLESLHRGEILSGTVAAIERFGVFVALDNGPDHPILPGVGFITIPELSWRHIFTPTDVVHVGQRVACEFLQFDTYNAEARLSLRALERDPFQAFADRTVVGQELLGTVDRVVPFGVFVDLGDGVVGLIPFREIHGRPEAGPPEAFEAGEEISVVVTDIERPRRRVSLDRPDESWPDPDLSGTVVKATAWDAEGPRHRRVRGPSGPGRGGVPGPRRVPPVGPGFS